MEKVPYSAGGSVRFFCNILKVGQPDSIKRFRWMRDGTELLDSKRYQGLSTERLSIQVAQHVCHIHTVVCICFAVKLTVVIKSHGKFSSVCLEISGMNSLEVV